LAAAAGLGLVGLANRKAIGRGISNVNQYMGDKNVFSEQYKDGNPTGRHYPHREKTSALRGFQDFKEWKKGEGINTSLTSTPLTRIAELGTHTLYDAATHGTQSLLWMIHPLELMAKGAGKVVDPDAALGGLGQALLAAGALQASAAVSGAYDPTNPSQLFRPEGFKQNNPDSDDGRVSTAPGEELFSRFMLGRTGRPLKYAHAKEEIPDLTIGRYKDYMNYMYRDKGLLNLGLAKATDENLQGVPEARMLGYPVTIGSMGTFLGGAVGAGIGSSLGNRIGAPPKLNQEQAQQVEEQLVEDLVDQIRKKEAAKNTATEVQEQANKIEDQTSKLKKGNMKAMAGGVAGVALGSLAGYFLSKFIEDNIKKGNDAYRQQQEIDEGRARPRGYYVTDGNNQIVSM
jgi:membrane protein YqaA with SNARE-associated domain